MKRLLLFIISILVLNACTFNNGKIRLTNDQKSDHSILIPGNADSLTRKAALEIQSYIFKVSGAELSIENSYNETKNHIIIGKAILKDSALLSGINSLKEDGFIIKTDDNDIILSGKGTKSNMFAAYTFIDEYLGCRLLSPTEEYIPCKDIIEIPQINKVYEPAFSFRRVHFPGQRNEKYRYWHKIETLDEWGSFVHTFNDLIPPEMYFEKHPEYFSFNNDHRLSDGQLCLSNPKVIEVLKKNLGKEIEKKPDMKYWSLSQNDCYNFCTCDNCNAMYEKYGSVSGAYIYMANQIAKAFPDKQISTLAYQFTRSAPLNIKPDSNVNIMFCSIECNRSMPLEDDKRSRGFVEDMKNWSRLTNNFFIWDYVVQFKNYLTPFPNFHVLQPNIRFFNKYNVNMMFQQGSGGSWSDLSELKQYLISKLLWNPEVNTDSIINDFMDKYYGPAKPFIRSYYDLTHKALKEKKEDVFLNIYGYPTDYFDSFLSEDLLKQYKTLMDKAEKAVNSDSVYLKRVLRTRLAVDFAYLDIALNRNLNDISYFKETTEGKKINEDMIEYLDRFVEISEQTATTRINERNYKTKNYKKYVLNKVNRSLRKNLARGKSVKLHTEYSNTYPVGGAVALTDALFGDLDFHNNWLGFQGNDLIVEIDLYKPEYISQISMNFLKAVNSWVFLPEEVFVEISSDGRTYKKISSLKGDNSDRSYLVKSIPFNIKFKPVKTQYIRIKAVSMKQCPKWHRGYGNPSWIFVDELIIE